MIILVYFADRILVQLEFFLNLEICQLKFLLHSALRYVFKLVANRLSLSHHHLRYRVLLSKISKFHRVKRRSGELLAGVFIRFINTVCNVPRNSLITIWRLNGYCQLLAGKLMARSARLAVDCRRQHSTGDTYCQTPAAAAATRSSLGAAAGEPARNKTSRIDVFFMYLWDLYAKQFNLAN